MRTYEVDGCCGACPEIVGGGIDCTCAGNPRCPNYQAEMSRWEVFQSLSGWWACPVNSLGVMDDKARHFPTHAEALAYADQITKENTQ